MTHPSSQVHMRHWRVLESFSASPKHSMDWSCDQTQTPKESFWHKYTHTQACTGIQGLWWIIYLMAHHIVMHPFISAAAEQTVERWEASLQGWQKVLIHERAGERLTDAHMLTKKFHKTFLPKLFRKVCGFLSPS